MTEPNRLSKREFDARILHIDMSPVLRSTDTIASQIDGDVTAEGPADADELEISDVSRHDRAVSFIASGGEAGILYLIRVRAITAGDPAQRVEGVADLLVVGE